MSKYAGAEGRRRLRDVLSRQQILNGSSKATQKIARDATVQTYSVGQKLIKQNKDDKRLAFILSGRVDIHVKGKKVAERTAGYHIGEMSVIDPAARRSATAIALEQTEVAWITEKNFSAIAKVHPELWRTLAIELANRLRQRGSLLRDLNPIPKIFIGSSSESLHVVKALTRVLGKANRPIHVEPWNDKVFGASEATIESLEKAAFESDFAILILSADDKVTIRKSSLNAPRDNVIFELGLFIGALDRKRTLMLVEKNREPLRLPPDLLGVTYLQVDSKNKKALTTTISSAAKKIEERISKLGSR